MVKRKAAGKTIEREDEPEQETNVIDLMDALKRSIKGGGGRKAAAALNASTSSKKTKRAKSSKQKRKTRAA